MYGFLCSWSNTHRNIPQKITTTITTTKKEHFSKTRKRYFLNGHCWEAAWIFPNSIQVRKQELLCTLTKNSEVKVAQVCLTLYNPMNCSLPGYSVHGILQARTLKWVAIFLSQGSSDPGIGPGSPANNLSPNENPISSKTTILFLNDFPWNIITYLYSTNFKCATVFVYQIIISKPLWKLDTWKGPRLILKNYSYGILYNYLFTTD